MKEHFVKVRNAFIKIKLYLSRTTSYIGLINTALILFLFLSNLERYGIDIEISQWIVPLSFIGFLGMVFFGYLEEKLGFYSQEQRTSSIRNPVMKDILSRLDRIEKKLDSKKKA